MNNGGSFLTSPVGETEIFSRENFTEEHQEIGKAVADFAKERIRPNKQEIEKYNEDLSRELMSECGELGLLGVDVPEEYGGLGLDKVTSAIVVENLSHGMCASFSTTFGAHSGIGTLPTVFFGTPAQKEKYLPKLASAEWLAGYALTEPEAGSDAISAKTTAKLSDDGKYYILNGTKQFITNAQWAGLFTVFAMVDGSKFSAFLVEGDTPGLSLGPEEKKMGVKGSSTCSVYFENAQVPVENLLGAVGGGAAIAFNSLNIGRFKLGAAALGGCKSVIKEALEYASQRRQFGREIRNFDIIKSYFADMAIRTFALDSIVYRTIGMIDEAIRTIPKDAEKYNMLVARAIEDNAIEASIVKVYGSESFAFVADMGLQILGGNGFIEEYPMASAVRDNRIDRIWEGTNEINRQIISGYFLKKALMEELPIREKTKGIRFNDLDPYEAEPLADEKHLFEVTRNITLFVLHEAISRFGQDLQNEQQLSVVLSDMFIDLYTMSSAIQRCAQAVTQKKEETHWLPMLQIHCTERGAAVAGAAELALSSILEEPYLSAAQKKLATLKNKLPMDINIFKLKAEIADYLYENDK